MPAHWPTDERGASNALLKRLIGDAALLKRLNGEPSAWAISSDCA
jgi:hypothetical protein